MEPELTLSWEGEGHPVFVDSNFGLLLRFRTDGSFDGTYHLMSPCCGYVLNPGGLDLEGRTYCVSCGKTYQFSGRWIHFSKRALEKTVPSLLQACCDPLSALVLEEPLVARLTTLARRWALLSSSDRGELVARLSGPLLGGETP